MKKRLLGAMSVLLLAGPVFAGADWKSGQTNLFSKEEVSDATDSFKVLLSTGDLEGAVKKYYGSLYDPTLPAWVVFIPHSGGIKQMLLYNGHARGHTLPGEPNLWVIVFVESGSVAGTTPVDGYSEGLRFNKPLGREFKVLYRPLDVQLGPAEKVFHSISQTLVKGKAGFDPLGDVSKNGAASAGWEVSVATIIMHPMSYDSTVPYYYGSGVVSLRPRTSNRLTLVPNDERLTFPGTPLKSAIINFGNGDRSYVAASLAGGAAFNVKEGDTRSHARGNMYLFAHFFLPCTRPIRPWGAGSLSFAVGTGLFRERFFHDFVTGVSIGHLFGTTGPVLGAQWYEIDTGQSRAIWKAAPFIGWNIPL